MSSTPIEDRGQLWDRDCTQQVGPRNRHSGAIRVERSLEDGMRKPILAGACLLLAASMASAQPVPTPAPRPKSSIAPPPAAAPEAPAGGPIQSIANNLFPFKFPGFGSSGTTTAFDAKQRGPIDRVNVYLMSVQNLVGDFVQVGP